jgi:hypothetical protein
MDWGSMLGSLGSLGGQGGGQSGGGGGMGGGGMLSGLLQNIDVGTLLSMFGNKKKPTYEEQLQMGQNGGGGGNLNNMAGYLVSGNGGISPFGQYQDDYNGNNVGGFMSLLGR